MKETPRYDKSSTSPMKNLFVTFYINFAGLMPSSRNRRSRFFLICVENITNWEIDRSTQNSTPGGSNRIRQEKGEQDL